MYRNRKNAVESAYISASEQLVEWVVDALPRGTYALAVFHDANENGKLDRHVLGYPTEAYGFSNNARGKLGPPTYAQVTFDVGDESLEIQVHVE